MNAYCYLGLPLEIQLAAKRSDAKIRSVIENEFGLPPGSLFNKSRQTTNCNGRQLYCSIIYHSMMKSNALIGEEAGGLDHATVIHARKVSALRLVLEKDFREKALRILWTYIGGKHQLMGEGFVKQQVTVVMERMIRNESHRDRLKKREERENVVRMPGKIPVDTSLQRTVKVV